MRILSMVVVFAALLAFAAGLAEGVSHHRDSVRSLDAKLLGQSDTATRNLTDYFGRARDVDLIGSNNPSLREFYAEPGDVLTKRQAQGPVVDQMNGDLAYLQRLYPKTIGEACIIDRGGLELARFVFGKRAPVGELSPDESHSSFFAPTFAAGYGHVYQAAPYISADTHRWVISNSTVINPAGVSFFHFEVDLDSFRTTALLPASTGSELQVFDTARKRVVVDTSGPLKQVSPLGSAASPDMLGAISADSSGAATVDGERVAFSKVPGGSDNANHWVVIARSGVDPAFGVRSMGAVAWILVLAGIGLIAAAFALFRGAGARDRRTAAEHERIERESLREREAAETANRLAQEAQARADQVEMLVEEARRTSASLAAAAQSLEEQTLQGERAVIDIVRAIEEVAAGTEQQQQAVDSALAEAERGRAESSGGVVASQNANQMMTDVNATAGELAATMRQLGARMGDVTGIVESITGIADQTNMLALNAAIEAARAGEHGRGFAVVADEVRKLAEESRASAGSIAEVISEVQGAASGAVAACEIVHERISQGAVVVEQNRAAFASVDETIGVISSALEQLAVLAQASREGADAVRLASDRSSQATSELMAQTEELSATAQQLAQVTASQD